MSDMCFWEELFLLESSYLKFLILQRCRKTLKVKKRIKIRKYLKRSTSLPQNPDEFVRKFGVKPKTFNYIFRKIYRHINKTLASPAEKRLAITLNFLASGESFNKLGPAYNLSQDSARIVVYETLEAISDHLGPKHMGKLSQKKLKSVAKRYYKKFKFPSCIGTIDKEFVKSRCMRKTAEYQKNVQVPIIGMADANYKFLAVDVAEPPNTQIPLTFLDTLDRELAKSSLPEQAYDSKFELPYVVLGTKYFPLRRYMIKPFPKRILADPEKKEFNNRFEEVHKIVEAAFNFLRNKWAVLTCGLKVDPKRIEIIVRCVCILHNILIDLKELDESDLDVVNVPRKMKRDEILSRSLNKSSKEALHMRETLKNYLLSQRRETENDSLEETERPAKRRRLASSEESSSSSDDDSDELDLLYSDDSSSDESNEEESEESFSSEGSASELDSDAEDIENEDDDVDIEDEIDIKEEPLDGDTDEDIKPDIGDLEELDTNASNEQNNLLEIKPDPDGNDREATAESEEPNSTTRADEVKIKEEPGINSSPTT